MDGFEGKGEIRGRGSKKLYFQGETLRRWWSQNSLDDCERAAAAMAMAKMTVAGAATGRQT